MIQLHAIFASGMFGDYSYVFGHYYFDGFQLQMQHQEGGLWKWKLYKGRMARERPKRRWLDRVRGAMKE